ncbi:unnamed protein product, partial [Plutella xylostella]
MQLRRQIRLVHLVQVVEGRARRVAVLHQLQHGDGSRTFQLRQHEARLEGRAHHARVGLDAADEVCALR